MPPEPGSQSLYFNLLLAKNSLNDSNRDLYVNFCNDICSIETSYILLCDANNNFKHFPLETFSIFHWNIRSINKNFKTFIIS